MTNKGSILSTAIAVVGELIIYQVLKMMMMMMMMMMMIKMMADDDDDEHICSEFLKLILSLFLVFFFLPF